MASCVIKKNEYGAISGVVTRDGSKSILFDKIMSIPFVETVEDAVKTYSNVLTDKFKSFFGQWENNIADNPAAVKKIKAEILEHPNYDNIVRVANTMRNPVLVQDTGEVLGDRKVYSTSIVGSEGLYLYDEGLVDTVDLEDAVVTDNTDISTYEATSIEGNPNPVIDLTTVEGSKVKAISSDQQISDVESLRYEDAVSPFVYENGEPRLYYLTPGGEVYEDYGEALRHTGGGNIEAGFISGSLQTVSTEEAMAKAASDIVSLRNNDANKIKLNNPQAFTKVLDINSDSNILTKEGLVNNLIRKGYLSANKLQSRNGAGYYITGAGRQRGERVYNANLAMDFIRLIPGFTKSRVDEYGRMYIIDDRYLKNRVLLAGENGMDVMSKERLKTMLKEGKYQDLKNDYPEIDHLIACIFLEDNELYHSNKTQLIEDEKARDLDLRRAMTKILTNLGISVVGMTEYLEKYKTKHGVEPSAKALADLGNKVIAIAEGAGIEDLTEEVSHFLVETYVDQDRITELLPEVENTDEWQLYSKQYYEVYGKQYSGEQLTDMVRREVLGKVLRNEFLNRFDKADADIANQSFFRRIVDVFADMVRRIQSYFSPSVKDDFNALVTEMADDILADDPNAFDITNLDEADFTLYSVADQKAMKVFEDARIALKAQLRNAQRAKSGTAQLLKSDLARVDKSINELASKLNDLNVTSTITNLVATTEAQTNYLNKLVKAYHNKVRSGSKEMMFDLTDQSNLDNINTLMAPMINQLRGFIETDPDLKLDNHYKRQILARIDTVNAKIAALNSEVKALRKIDNSSLLNRLLDLFNVSEEGRKVIVDFLNGAMKDVSWMTRWFGTLEHSKNPILQMLMGFITQNNYNANARTQDDMRTVISRAQAQGFDVKRFEGLLQKDGQYYSSYLLSEIDDVKFRHEFEAAQAAAIKAAVPGIAEDVDTILKNGVKIGSSVFKPNIHGVRLNELTEEQLQVYEDRMNAWLGENTERRYNKEYYEEIEKMYEKAATRDNGVVRPISRSARDFMSALSGRRYQVKQRFMDADGNVNWTELYKDIDAVEELKDIRRSEKMASSLVDPRTGEAKKGRELELAEDIRAINKAWGEWAASHSAGRTVKTKEFMDELKAIQKSEGSAAAFEFLIANSNIRFSSTFWDSLGQSNISRVEEILDPNSDTYRHGFDEEPLTNADMESLKGLVDSLKSLQSKQKEIMRAYYESDTPGEIDYDNMPEEAKQKIKQIQEEIQYVNSEIRNITKDPEYGEGAETEYTNNQAFERALADSVDDAYTFCRKHATSQNQGRMDNFRHKMGLIKKGQSVRFSPYELRIIEESGLDVSDNESLQRELQHYASSNPEILDSILDRYAKTMVLPYFKRFAPKGYEAWLNSVKTQDVVKMTERIMSGKPGPGVESMLTIEPVREWQTEGREMDKYKNKRYKENSDHGYYQPNVDKYRNAYYFEHFGISQPGGRATKNVEDKDMIDQLVQLKRKAIGEEGYREGNRSGHNLYEIPQISKSSVERLYQLKENPGITIRNALRDMMSVRVDDPIYGQASDMDVEGVDMKQFKVIPKYYLRELGERSDVSHDLVRSYTLMMLQANLYDEKMGTIGEVMGLQQMLLNSKFEKGVIPEASNTYNMFKEWLEAHFYGVQTNTSKMEIEVLGKKIDVSKMASTFDRAIRYHNLAFSIPVALTGAVTGQINAVVEGAVGQYINLPSLRYADVELLRLSSGYISDIGNIDRQNKLYVLGERMGIYSIKNRTASAGYNKAMRIIGDGLGFKMMDIFNSPIAPKIMISVMDDTRVAEDGKFYRYNSFARKTAYDERQAGRTISSREIRRKWDALRDRSLYNAIEVKNGEIKIKEGFNKELVERQMRVTQREIRSLNQICEGYLSPEDKSSATRNWMMNFTMAHRGWFQIAFQRRYKAMGYNFSTNQIEEGSNRTVLRYVMKSLSLLKEGKTKELFDVINSKWHTMSDWERTNLYRSMIDMTVFMFGVLAWSLAMSYDDDDESSWGGQLLTYITLRTINEMYSQLPVLMEVNAVETLYNPFPLMAKMRDLVTLRNWSFDEVQSGTYKGETKLWRLFAKQTFLKQWYAMKSDESIKATRRGWLLNNPTMFFDRPKKDENEE